MTEDNSIRARLRKFGRLLPEQGRNEFYANTTARLDTIAGNSGQVWAMINRASAAYANIKQPKESFYVWLQQEYGLKLCFTPEGDIELTNEIVDQQKYTIFLLKFSHD